MTSSKSTWVTESLKHLLYGKEATVNTALDGSMYPG